MQRNRFILISIAFVAIYITGLFSMPLLEPDEGRYIAIPAEMTESGDVVLPTLNGVPYIEKPPLMYWLNASLLAAFGDSAWVGRVWPMLLTLMIALMLFLFVLSEAGRRPAAISALIFLASTYTLALSRINNLDEAFAFFVTATMFCVYLFFKNGHKTPLYGIWAFAALGFMAKGLAAIVLPAGGIFIFCLWMRKPFQWVKLLSPLPILLFAAITVPWLVALEMKLPGALDFLIIHEHFSRFTTDVHHHSAPIYYFIPILIGGLIPWAYGIVPAVFSRGDGEGAKSLNRFLWAWAGFILIFFSFSSSKLPTYLTPMWPAACALVGLALARRTESSKALRISIAFSCWLIAVGFAAMPYIQLNRYTADVLGDVTPALFLPAAALALLAGLLALRKGSVMRTVVLTSLLFSAAMAAFAFPMGGLLAKTKSAEGIAAVIERSLDDNTELSRYRVELQGLSFLLHRRVTVVGSAGELTFGRDTLPDKQRERWFPSVDEFAERWAGKKRILCVMRRGRLVKFNEEIGPSNTVGSYGRFVVVDNRR